MKKIKDKIVKTVKNFDRKSWIIIVAVVALVCIVIGTATTYHIIDVHNKEVKKEKYEKTHIDGYKKVSYMDLYSAMKTDEKLGDVTFRGTIIATGTDSEGYSFYLSRIGNDDSQIVCVEDEMPEGAIGYTERVYGEFWGSTDITYDGEDMTVPDIWVK